MPRPWSKRADELEPTEGVWADYAAFKEWLSAQETRLDAEGMFDAINDSAGADGVKLYCLMCDLADGAESEAT